MSGNLARLPNYTCNQRIQRTVRPLGGCCFVPLDTFKLEVSYVGGRELFAWPGASKFEDRRLSEMVRGLGAVGNGGFALHARAIFVNEGAQITYVREDSGRLQYDFSIPESASNLSVGNRKESRFVGYRGSFWVDKQSLDLARIEVRVDEMPPGLGLRSSSDSVEYRRTSIGGSDFLLPHTSILTIVDARGSEGRNVSQFTACRQYSGESNISFDEPGASTEGTAEIKTVRLGPGLEISASLVSPVRFPDSAVGEPVSATLLKRVRYQGLTIPKGAKLSGRVTRLEVRRGALSDYLLVGLQFSTLELEGARVELTANLESMGYKYEDRFLFPGKANPKRPNDPAAQRLPGEGLIYVRGEPVLPEGFRMVWRTVSN